MIINNRSLKSKTKLIGLIMLLWAGFFYTSASASISFPTNDSLIRELHRAEPDEMPAIYNLLAKSFLEDEAEKSLNYTDTAISLASLQAQHNDVLDGMHIKARAYFSLDLEDSAFSVLARAEDYCKKIKDLDGQLSTLNLRADLCSKSNDYKTSIRYHFMVFDIQTNRKDTTGLVETLYEMALDYDQWGKYDSALLYYDKGHRLASLTNDSSSIANFSNNIGNIYLSWGDYNKALDLYLEALKIYEASRDSSGISNAYNNIGIIYSDWQDLEKSLHYYILSYRVDSLMGNKHGQAQSLNNIAINYDELGQKEKALEVYQLSLLLAEELQDNYLLAVTKGNIGGYYLEEGEYKKAEQYFDETLEEYKKANSISGIAETDILLAELFKEQGDYEKALKYYYTGLRKVKELNISWVISEAYQGLADVAALTGDYKNAYLHNLEYQRIQDSIFNAETSTQLALLSNAYEIQKQEHEMEIQVARLSEQKSRIRRQQISLFALAGTIVLIAIFSILLIRSYRLRMKAWKQLMQQHEEILSNRKQLIEAKEKAEESDRLKGAFLVNLSHELRTPMNGIMGFTDLLQKGAASAEQQRTYLSYIASASRQLLKVLNDIIDISTLETGQLELEIEACDIKDTCQEIMQQMEEDKADEEKTAIKLILEEPDDAELIIMADRRRLSQILYNLLNNALLFTKEGSITLGYKILEEKTIQFFVRDTGSGIERSKFEVIFDRFRQADESTTRQHGGSGLGLAICKELLIIMGGRIYLESEVGKGSTFFVEIPYKSVHSRQ